MSDQTLMSDAPTATVAAASPAAPAATTEGTAPAAGAAAESTTTPAEGDAAQQQASTTDPATTEEPATEKAEGEEKPAEKAAPEKYEFKAPEGVTLDSELLGEFEGIARELNLTQEDAQKAVDIAAKMQAKFQAKQTEVLLEARTEWAKQTTADKEIGGTALAANVAVAEKALATFGSPELRALLKETGLGNHPEVVRAFVKVGKAISEDRFVSGGEVPPGGLRSAAQRMYPNMNP